MKKDNPLKKVNDNTENDPLRLKSEIASSKSRSGELYKKQDEFVGIINLLPGFKTRKGMYDEEKNVK